MLDPAIPLVENPATVRHSGSTAPMKGSQRRSASHVADRRCVDPDAAEALAGTNVIEAADLTQNAVNDVVEGEHRRRHQRRGDVHLVGTTIDAQSGMVGGGATVEWALNPTGTRAAAPGAVTGRHRLEENLAAASIQLSTDDLLDIEKATSADAVQGGRGTGGESYG